MHSENTLAYSKAEGSGLHVDVLNVSVGGWHVSYTLQHSFCDNYIYS